MRSGISGISGDDLNAVVYNNNRPNGHGIRERRVTSTLSAHINQINEAIEFTGYRIIGRGGYRLEKRR
jgi:hypothetical protein